MKLRLNDRAILPATLALALSGLAALEASAHRGGVDPAEARLHAGPAIRWLSPQAALPRDDIGARLGYRLGMTLTIPRDEQIAVEIGGSIGFTGIGGELGATDGPGSGFGPTEHRGITLTVGMRWPISHRQTASDAFLSDLREEIAAWVAAMPGTVSQPIDGSFDDRVTGMRRPARILAVSGSWTALGDRARPFDAIADALRERGWREIPEYTADGPGAAYLALASNGAICIIRAVWNAGDPPDDAYQFLLVLSPSTAQPLLAPDSTPP